MSCLPSFLKMLRRKFNHIVLVSNDACECLASEGTSCMNLLMFNGLRLSDGMLIFLIVVVIIFLDVDADSLQVESLNQLMFQVLAVEIVVNNKVVDELTKDGVDYVDHVIACLIPCVQVFMTSFFVRACSVCC